jgi:carbonic anhydrase
VIVVRPPQGVPRLGILALITLGLAACSLAGASPSARPEFGYAGDVGPGTWGDLDPEWRTCTTGERQSPIDLAEPQPETATDPGLDYVAGDGSVSDSGHTVTIALPAGSSLELDGTTYALQQLHFHSPGEHPFGGNPAAVEWHFVHRSPNGALAVVAVLLDEGLESAAWRPVVDAVAVAPADGTTGEVRGLDPAALLPASRASLRYEGSLTTPPCTEGVRWTVLTERLQLSGDQLATLRSRYSGNSRPAQEPNGRAVRDDGADG